MKPATAYSVASLAVDWLDKRALQLSTRRARQKALREFWQEHEDSDPTDVEKERDEATASQHAAYMVAAKEAVAARARFTSAVARARKEMQS